MRRVNKCIFFILHINDKAMLIQLRYELQCETIQFLRNQRTLCQRVTILSLNEHHLHTEDLANCEFLLQLLL